MALAVQNLFDVQGKTALVTGGSRGIGLMIARGLVANGAHVFIVARKAKQCDAAAAALNLEGPGTCTSLPADLTTDAACRALAAAVRARAAGGQLHVLVNNAGSTWGAHLEEFPEQAWEKVMSLNVTSVFQLTRACLPLLEAAAAAGGHADPARVINIGSVMGQSVNQYDNAFSYSASKAAVAHLTRVLGASLTPKHITVNCIAPAFFPSKMTAFRISDDGEADPMLVAQHPIGRIGKESDMAGLVLFLASKAGAFVSGAVIPLDGGFLLGQGGSKL